MITVASLLADFTHFCAIFTLLGFIANKKTCEGISGKMQVLYAIVFTTRYLDIMESPNYYLLFGKISFIILSYLTILLIYVVYKKTYEREYDLFWIETLLVLCLGVSLIFCRDISDPEEVFWAFSRYLEAVVFVPQLYFTYKKEFKSNLITYYVLALILYRGFYILHWLLRYQEENSFDGYTVYPGLVQFAIYFFFFFLPQGQKNKTILPVTMVGGESTLPPLSRSATGQQPPPADVSSPRTPNLARQESLLETPFLKRNATSYTSIYTIGSIGKNGSKNSSLNGSINSLNALPPSSPTVVRQEGRY